MLNGTTSVTSAAVAADEGSDVNVGDRRRGCSMKKLNEELLRNSMEEWSTPDELNGIEKNRLTEAIQ